MSIPYSTIHLSIYPSFHRSLIHSSIHYVSSPPPIQLSNHLFVYPSSQFSTYPSIRYPTIDLTTYLFPFQSLLLHSLLLFSYTLIQVQFHRPLLTYKINILGLNGNPRSITLMSCAREPSLCAEI